MDFLGPGLAQRHDAPARRRAPDDGIVHHHHAFPADHIGNHRKLHVHTTGALVGIGHDKRPSDVMVPHKPEIEGDAALPREPQRRRVSAVRHRRDKIGLHRMLLRQPHPELDADVVDALPEHRTVRTGKIHMLEDAVGKRLLVLFREPGAP